jgi:drug/metabolite transporter (DMT)-like permease
MLAASLAYGVASVYAKRRLHGISSLGAATGQQVGAILVLSPLGIISGTEKVGTVTLQPELAIAVLGLGLLCTSVAYLLYFHLIAATGAVRTSSVTFLIPVFGILWSVIFLGEAVPPGAILGLLMILGGVGIVSGNALRTWLGRLRLVRSSA